ncbi:hypothetical protein SAMN05660337_2006 [Maridesulfovibrio ferrireducens]|uniref:Uncharacterized protein n=1 Tax=Maridesulfovibrio ferrireducens TaxID=246191 RepID=A0A1G9H4L4_9BACT|nr:hypothetical protein [Maridesulfovibrio ferrireducens]SDL07907.1 hypothetical protein SAMN05660337_2006 [Maridesulfovibrio ferrireducens]
MATGTMLAVGSMAASVVGGAMSSGGGGGGGAAVGQAASSAVQMAGGGFNAQAGIGMMTDFGKSVFDSGNSQREAAYNSQMAELQNINNMQRRVYSRNSSYKEAQLIRKDAEIKLATLRRELYRREHSLGGYKGVRLDSGSIVDVKEDTIRQARYDAEIVKYQADVSASRHLSQGDMAVWSGTSSAILDKNQSDHVYGKKVDGLGSSLVDKAGKNLTSILS